VIPPAIATASTLPLDAPPVVEPRVVDGPSAADPATERLEELERLQALVVATIAHELRTPLTVLRVHADLLIEGASDLGQEERRSLEAISRAVARLQDVSDHLVSELRGTAGGAEDALRRWLQAEPGCPRTRPTAA
jgi:signal transduction histidine kinase